MKKLFYILFIITLFIAIYFITKDKNSYIKLDYNFKYDIKEIRKADPKNDGNIYLSLYLKNNKLKTYNVYYSYNNEPYKINLYNVDNYYVVVLKCDKTYISFFNKDGLHINTIDSNFENINITDSVKVDIKEDNTITYKYYVKDDILFKEIDNIIN